MEDAATSQDAKIREDCTPGKPLSVFTSSAHKVSSSSLHSTQALPLPKELVSQ